MKIQGQKLLYLILFIFGLVSGVLYVRYKEIRDADKELSAVREQQETEASSSIEERRTNSIVTAVDKVQGSVVGIVVTQLKYLGKRYYYEDFFDLFLAPKAVPKYREVQNMGSGVIIDEEGLILTNNHVVEGAKELYVNFPDGRRLKGEIKGRDKYSDLAVISVEGSGFNHAEFADSDRLRIGEWVIAIGNPFLSFFNDSKPTVTVGVISALNRNFSPKGDVYYQNMIQTDAAINPGNSGGALVNGTGKVVGINAFIYTGGSRSSGSIGIGFAIPVNAAVKVAEELISFGQRRPVWTGITVQDVDRRTALLMGLDEPNGVIIKSIKEGSPGDESGLKKNDIIVAMGHRRINDHKDLEGVFVAAFPGDTVAVRILRNSEREKREMVLKEYPE
ncbi:MAG: S1C family serine protease [Chitinivibrionales bacterium]